MLKTLLRLIILALVGFSGGELIAHALHGVFIRHYGCDLAVTVQPILYVVLVSALVVEPGAAVADPLAADADG